jgi:hypothetical protein
MACVSPLLQSPMKPEFSAAPPTTGTSADGMVSGAGLQGVYKLRSSTLPIIQEERVTIL